MERIQGMLFAAVALVTLGLSGPSFGQAKTTDIVGLKLGMSPDEARAAVKAHDAAIKVVDMASWNARPGVPASLAKIRGCTSTVPNGPCKDEIVVTFGHLSKKALFVTRVLKLGNGVLHQAAADYEGKRLVEERALLVAAVKAHQEEIERAAKGWLRH
ncbi:hypothetical protein [Rugamonas rubra]|uniref:Uncharacterized protein n=1 Tax=Rugamonas rubra TaxID=758825 RepID=A0A1I4PEL1_9BURK|nr:hypothetical protein [Rugamonas rubra]SFM26005.1 hypothetical protein SAMN02982985_03360 [Rugamonas rubra]